MHPPLESKRVTFGTAQESRLRSAPYSQGCHSATEVRTFNSHAFGLTPMAPAQRTSSGSAHFILAGLPAWVILLGFTVGTSYPAN